VTRDGHHVELTATEYRLLRYLMLNPRRVLTRSQLLEHVWEYDFGGDARVLETYVSYLRRMARQARAAAHPHRARRRLRAAPAANVGPWPRSAPGCWRPCWCSRRAGCCLSAASSTPSSARSSTSGWTSRRARPRRRRRTRSRRPASGRRSTPTTTTAEDRAAATGVRPTAATACCPRGRTWSAAAPPGASSAIASSPSGWTSTRTRPWPRTCRRGGS
jgi:hypothetical protein